MKIVVDSDIFIDHFRNYRPGTDFLLSAFEKYDVNFSAVTEAELLSGWECNDKAAEDRVLALLLKAAKIPVDNEIARRAGELVRKSSIPMVDSFIAATALKLDAPLYSRNTRHFEKVKGLKIISPYN